MAQRKQKRYRPSWEREKMVWDPFGMWVRYVAPDTKEIAPSASTNTGSPKLPTLEVCIANLYRDTAAGTVGLTAVEVAKNVHGYISRQLLAGA